MTGYNQLAKRRLYHLTVLEFASKGLTIREIAQKTGYSVKKVENILHHVNESTKSQMSMVIQDRVALEYEKSLMLLDYLLKRSLEVEQKATDQRVVLQAISTTLQINQSKNQLISDSAMIAKAIQRSALVLPLPSKPSRSKDGQSVKEQKEGSQSAVVSEMELNQKK